MSNFVANNRKEVGPDLHLVGLGPCVHLLLHYLVAIWDPVIPKGHRKLPCGTCTADVDERERGRMRGDNQDGLRATIWMT